FVMTSSAPRFEPFATRGNRLAIFRNRWEGSGDPVGPSEVEWLEVLEVDASGGQVALVVFDPDDLDAAYTELDHRFAAGEAAPHARTWETSERVWRAFVARDWGEMAACFATDLISEDHRRARFGTLSRDEFMGAVRALVDLAPDATMRCDHVLALDDRGLLFVQR